jgi:hypothetical protein
MRGRRRGRGHGGALCVRDVRTRPWWFLTASLHEELKNTTKYFLKSDPKISKNLKKKVGRQVRRFFSFFLKCPLKYSA